jgi:hypothetical protein
MDGQGRIVAVSWSAYAPGEAFSKSAPSTVAVIRQFCVNPVFPRYAADTEYGTNSGWLACLIRGGALPLAPANSHIGEVFSGRQRIRTVVNAVRVDASDGSSVPKLAATTLLVTKRQDCALAPPLAVARAKRASAPATAHPAERVTA